jgi:hypothetical protein
MHIHGKSVRNPWQPPQRHFNRPVVLNFRAIDLDCSQHLFAARSPASMKPRHGCRLADNEVFAIGFVVLARLHRKHAGIVQLVERRGTPDVGAVPLRVEHKRARRHRKRGAAFLPPDLPGALIGRVHTCRPQTTIVLDVNSSVSVTHSK